MQYNQRIRDLREDKDYTQKYVAEYLKTSQSYYAQYENGKRQMPVDRLKELCYFYNISADYILGFTNEQKPLPKK